MIKLPSHFSIADSLPSAIVSPDMSATCLAAKELSAIHKVWVSAFRDHPEPFMSQHSLLPKDIRKMDEEVGRFYYTINLRVEDFRFDFDLHTYGDGSCLLRWRPKGEDYWNYIPWPLRFGQSAHDDIEAAVLLGYDGPQFRKANQGEQDNPWIPVKKRSPHGGPWHASARPILMKGIAQACAQIRDAFAKAQPLVYGDHWVDDALHGLGVYPFFANGRGVEYTTQAMHDTASLIQAWITLKHPGCAIEAFVLHGRRVSPGGAISEFSLGQDDRHPLPEAVLSDLQTLSPLFDDPDLTFPIRGQIGDPTLPQGYLMTHWMADIPLSSHDLLSRYQRVEGALQALSQDA